MARHCRVGGVVEKTIPQSANADLPPLHKGALEFKFFQHAPELLRNSHKGAFFLASPV